MNFAKIFQLTPNVQVLAVKKDDPIAGTYDVQFLSDYNTVRAEIVIPYTYRIHRDKFFNELTLIDAQRFRLRMDEKVIGL